MIIYKATNKITEKYYIGQTVRSLKDRILSHERSWKTERNTYFSNALHKYGNENFKWEILEECDSKEELDEMEFHYIKQYNSKRPNGYNLTDGGDKGTFGWVPTEETRENISLSQKGKKISEETREKIRKSLMENHPMKGKSRDDIKGDNNPAKRPEIREKISKAKTGHIVSSETKNKISNTLAGTTWEEKFGKEKADRLKKERSELSSKLNKGKVISEESKNKMRESSVKHTYKVISPDNEVFYIKSLNKFADDYGYPRASIKYHVRYNTDSYKGWKIRKI